jgi:hypothetical protein
MAQQQNVHKTYTEGHLYIAISDIKSKQIRSKRLAAEVYSISQTTFQDRRAGQRARRECEPNSKRLTKLEEEVVRDNILDVSLHGVCNNAGKMRDPDLAWSHSEAYGSAWENRNLGSIDTYRSCKKGLQKTAYLHLGDCNVKYTKAMKC